MQIKKIIAATLLIAMIGIFFGFPEKSQAAIGMHFGGLDVAETYCTCSANFWIWFAPLYFTSVPVTGALVYEPFSIGYSYYVPFPSTWVLGTFIPGVQTCWMYAGYFCFPMLNYGLINWVTGTSL